jgi:hypothetical protein
MIPIQKPITRGGAHEYQRATLKFKPEWVSLIDNTQKGSYQWATVNYLLDQLGKPLDKTMGVADLGGGLILDSLHKVENLAFIEEQKHHKY